MKATKSKEMNVVVISLVLGILLFTSFLIFLYNSNNIEQGQSIDENVAASGPVSKSTYPRAIELVTPNYYHNLPEGQNNITIGSLIGKKVILVDFWTYSCINCQRTLAYLNSWYEKYRDEGLEIISIHTPEFGFEKEFENVRDAIAKYEIKYPVVQDNDYQTWRAYNNRYWPRKYLIDIDGFVVYDHIGEGAYNETEQKIQELLSERALRLGAGSVETEITTIVDAPSFQQIATPELYAGYNFDRGQLGNGEGRVPDTVVNYTLPRITGPNLFYLGGEWLNGPEALLSVSDNAQIKVTYTAKKVHIVLGAANTSIRVSINGGDEKTILVNGQDLYTLDDADSYGTRTALITVPAGVSFYTFTFG